MYSKLISGIMVTVILITGLAAVGCPRPESPAAPTAQELATPENWPEVLRIGSLPGEEKELRARFEPTRSYLERELGIPVELFIGSDYTAVIEAMRAKRLEAARFGPFSYILAAERANAEAIAAPATAEGLHTYHSYLITHPGTGLENMEDVRRRSKELTLAWVDPASTSGFLIPKGYLLSIGIDPDRDFKEVIFAGTHDKAALAVKAGKVDIAAQTVHRRMIDRGKIAAEEVIELWKSPPIPPSPWAVRGDLAPEFKARLQQALLDLAEKDLKAFEAQRWRAGTVDLVAVDDSVYDELRVLARALGYK